MTTAQPAPSGVARTTSASTRWRGDALLLVAALSPIVIAVARAWITRWVPLGDNGYFVARSRDVLTAHHPFVGALSAGSTAVDDTVNNLGPLQLNLLAPFTKVDPHRGTALGAGLMNAAAVVGVWLTARRMFRPAGVIGVMLATVALQAAIGGALLVDVRQQVALLLPYWCFLWLVTAMWAGHLWATPWAAFVASLLLQTHLSYAYQIAALSLAAGLALGLTLRGRWREGTVLRWGAATGAVLVVSWAQTAWDQLFGSGNLGAAFGSADTDGAGVAAALQVVADSVLVPPFWAPGGITSYLAGGVIATPSISVTAATVVLALWALAIAGVAVAAWRWRQRTLGALCGVSSTALVAALAAATQLPELPDAGLAPQNYFWMWPTGIFVTVTLAAGIGALIVRRNAGAWTSRSTSAAGRRAVIGAAVVLLASLPGWRSSDYWPQSPYSNEVARDVLGSLRAGLAQHDIDGPVVTPFFWSVGIDSFNFMILTELQRAGIEFAFPDGTPNIRRFGEDRCMTGSERHRIVSRHGHRSVDVDPEYSVLARIDRLPPDDARQLEVLDARFGDALRDGTVEVNVGAASYFGFTVPDDVLDVLDIPGQAATGLATTLQTWRAWRMVDVPAHATADWERWVELEQLSDTHRVAIMLAPNHVTDPSRTC